MPLSDRPFHLLGIGNGGSIAAAFACKYAAHPRWKPTLRTLTCVNGFATVDTQLAAVLHSAQGAFRCFPPDRPDLPITFWSRYGVQGLPKEPGCREEVLLQEKQ